MQFSLYIKGNFQQRLNEATRKFPADVQNTVKRATAFMWARVHEKTPTSFGNLKKSVSAKVSKFRGVIEPTVKYGFWVHEGTKPHWMPRSEWANPSGSLYKWAMRKGLNPFLVARAIARKGTKKQPWMKETFRTYEDEVRGYFDEAVDSLLDKVKD
jgi:hypothetical protein